MDNNFLSHIVRDLFLERVSTIIYGWDEGLRVELLKPEHSIGAFQMHTERNNFEDSPEHRFWEIGINDPYIDYGNADLFISINYNPNLFTKDLTYVALQVKKLLKVGGKAILINPGYWSNNIKNLMTIDGITTREAKRYSMLKDEDILIYENI
jgi:hypothetical protein